MNFDVIQTLNNMSYKRHHRLTIEEDMTHEFKAHRQLSFRDLSNVRYTHAHNGNYIPKVGKEKTGSWTKFQQAQIVFSFVSTLKAMPRLVCPNHCVA